MDEEISRLGESVAIRGRCDGVPVYGFGYTYVYGISPDFLESRLQRGNDSPCRKIRPKKSWDITMNKLGATPPREPRTARVDKVPLLGINLIDGDPETYWSSRPQNQPDVEPAWIRIDLAMESRITSVMIVPRQDSRGMPKDICVKVSRDAWHWETVYENSHYAHSQDIGPHLFNFAPRQVKQVWIIGKNLSSMPPPRISYAFSVAEVRVLDERGRNVALVSRGAGVTVSSCDFGLTSPREKHDMLWPTHFDLGVKWVRVGYAAPSALNWNLVERRKGEYQVDTAADRAITQLVDNGINVVLCLGFTNWLYTPEGQQDPMWAKQIQESTETHGPGLPAANISGMLAGYKEYVRFMVRQFKERVKHYEIWNEPPGYGGMGGDIDLYGRYFLEVAPVIRKEFQQAKIITGSVGGWESGAGIDALKSWLEKGVGPMADVIAWHPCYGCDPKSSVYRNYPAVVKELKKFAEQHGFRGEYMATEWLFTAPYPPAKLATGYPPASAVSEIVKAKYAARYAIMNLGLNILAFWNETWADYNISWDCGLFRNTFSSDPISPSQPQPVYYVIRTLSTVLEEATPVEMIARFSTDRPIEQFSFELPGKEKLLAVWLGGSSEDLSEEVQADVILPGVACKVAVGIDVLNGTEEGLHVSKEGNDAVLKDMLIRDYPILIRYRQE